MPVSSTSFDQRLSRINNPGGGGGTGYGKKPRQPSIVLSILSGVLGYLVFCLAAWHGMDRTPLQLSTLQDLGIIAGGALVAGWAVRSLFNIKGRGVALSHALGLVIAFSGLHMAVHASPDHFERAFAPEWVQQTLTQTEPKLMTPNAGLMAAQTIVLEAIKEFEDAQDFAANF